MICSNSFSNSLLRASITSIRNCSTVASSKSRSKRGVICQPPLSSAEVRNIKNILGLYVGSNYVSWVSIETEKNEISQMGITSFPENFEKMNLCGLSAFAFQSFQMLPQTNYYVMEEEGKAVGGTTSPIQLRYQSSQMRYVAMLVALMNFEANASEKPHNRVLFLKHKLPARLFGLLVGKEVVSSTRMMKEILNQNIPPRFTPLKCSDNLKSQYISRSRIHQEIIGYSIMTAITFLEFMVRQNEKCFEFLRISIPESNVKKSNENVTSSI